MSRGPTEESKEVPSQNGESYPTGVLDALRALAPGQRVANPQEDLNTALVHGMVASLGLETGTPKPVGEKESAQPGVKSPSPTWIHPNLYYNTEEDRFSLKSDGDIFGCKVAKDIHKEMVSPTDTLKGPRVRAGSASVSNGATSEGSSSSGVQFQNGLTKLSKPELKENLSVNMKQLAQREERLSYLEIIMDLMRENKKLRAKLGASQAAYQGLQRSSGPPAFNMHRAASCPVSREVSGRGLRGHAASFPNSREVSSRGRGYGGRARGSSVQTQTHPIQPEVRYMGNKEMKQELKTLKSKLSKTRSEVRRLVTKRKTDQAMYEAKLKDANEVIIQLRRNLATITSRQMNRNSMQHPGQVQRNYYHQHFLGQSG